MTETVNAATFANLPLASIRLSATNPRKTSDPAALRELTESIRVSGVQVPILVRPVEYSATDDPALNGYELVCGSRRYSACEGLGLETVPAIVREMTDEEVRDAQIVENLQRADVAPMEEAEAFHELLQVTGSEAAVAARLGKEVRYVARRLRLMALTLASRDALRGQLITIEHAMLLARLAAAEQDVALKWTLDHSAGVKVPVAKVVEQAAGYKARVGRSYPWEPQSVARLKAWIEAESGILLNRAPWSLVDDGGLVAGAPNCAECSKNTQANSPLFGDLEMGEATCTDGAQFAAKTAAFVQIAIRKSGLNNLGAKGQPCVVPRLSWKQTSVKPSVVPNDVDFSVTCAKETANPAKVLKQGQWVEAKPGSCANVRPGVTVDWSDDGNRGYMGRDEVLRKPGEELQVCIAVGCKVHPKDWEAKPAGGGDGRDREAEQKKEEEKRQAFLAAEVPARKAVFAAIAKEYKPERVTVLRRLMRSLVSSHAAAAVCELAEISFEGEKPYGWQAYQNATKALNDEISRRSESELMKLTLAIFARPEMEIDWSDFKQKDRGRAELWRLAASVGVDADAVVLAMGGPVAKQVPAKKVAAVKKVAGTGGAHVSGARHGAPKAPGKKVAGKKVASKGSKAPAKVVVKKAAGKAVAKKAGR